MLRRETFSIWPLVAVAAVMVIAAAFAVPRMLCDRGPSKAEVAARIVSHAAKTRFPMWRASHTGCPRFAGELLDEPVDPWSRPYRVVCVTEPPVVHVTSAGEDGRFGTADDISSFGMVP